MSKSDQNKLKILILSAPIGSGHRLAAEALKEYLEAKPGVVVEHGNVFNFFPEVLGKLFLGTYLKILDWCPWLYALVYKWGNQGGGSLWVRALINKALAILGRSYILNQSPAAVIATHATPAGIMSYIKEQKHLWLGCVVTDYTVHRWWLVDGADAYFVAAPELEEKLPGAKAVKAFGIPLRKAFTKLDRSQAKQQVGWEEASKVCLLLGGGEGLLPMEDIISQTSKCWPENLLMVAITGHNAKLKLKLEQSFKDLIKAGRLKVEGFRQDLPQLMAAADLVITKAGGLSTTELLAAGVDFIIYKPLPGQEMNNAKFLQQHYQVGLAQSLEELEQQFLHWQEGSAFTEKKQYYGKPQAAQQIGDYILQQLNYSNK